MAGFACSYDFSNEPPRASRNQRVAPGRRVPAQIISNEEKTAKSGGFCTTSSREIPRWPARQPQAVGAAQPGSH